MWAKAVELLMKWLLIPLIRDGVSWLYKQVTEYFRKRKLKKDNDKKVEKYEKADNPDDADDSFQQLP